MKTRVVRRRRGRPSSLAKQVAEILRRDVVSGALAPGQKVAEQALADSLGVSRVPAREAMMILEREGLFVRSETGRLRVTDLKPRDLQEIGELRLLIEPQLVREAAVNHRPEDMAALERNLAALAEAEDVARISLVDAEFHELIAAASHHRRLIQVWNLLRGQFLLWLAIAQREATCTFVENRQGTLANHEAILKLIRSRDGAAAHRHVHEQLSRQAGWYKDK